MAKKTKRKADTAITTIRMPKDLLKALDVKAKKVGISRSQLVQLVLRRDVQDAEVKDLREAAMTVTQEGSENGGSDSIFS